MSICKPRPIHSYSSLSNNENILFNIDNTLCSDVVTYYVGRL